ncbi:UDP-3-O-(3-hydroxymyristoyl)glucosamine N-acyltransferase [Vibrio splendidus]|uniref:UDP-3-O-(3-hydroxymyristoyl)glucosamine N-acyltransferase n=1 Tax=Vibrio splendidus TaxID=29497 RepID=UPI000CC019D3|nr:UDP-3-O-(3-hydroxymyristoyl)glucosamine N-acyltransferase [Vibrio splendidus]PMK39052.1 hypothetical protein BCU01_20005 [Vibrio splendidus]
MNQLNISLNIKLIAKELGLQLVCVDSFSEISNVSQVGDKCKGSLFFTNSFSDVDKNSCAIVKNVPDEINITGNYIVSTNPRLSFIKALLFIEKSVGFNRGERKPLIDPSVKVGRNVTIEDNVVIGKHSVIEHNVVLHSGTHIGENCLVRSGAIIGSDGFGFERDSEGVPYKFLHFGGVRIGNHVEIGANTCIARGTFSDTIVEEYVKIDNLVHIAHNCLIGKGSFITACSELSGGVQIGKNTWIAPNTSIKEKLVIGSDSLLGIGSVVTKNVKEGDVVFGSPAKSLKFRK